MDLNLFLVVAGTICNLAMAVFSVTNKKTDNTKETIEAMTKMTIELEHLSELFNEFKKEIRSEMELKRSKIEQATNDIAELKIAQENLNEKIKNIEERMNNKHDK